MGCHCTTPRRDELEENECLKTDQKKDDASTSVDQGENSPFLKREPSLQDRGEAVKTTTDKETLKEQEKEDTVSDNFVCIEKSSTLSHDSTVVKVNTPSSCLSETHDAASSTEEEKEAGWVDANRSRLIQEVTLVKPIADKMLELNVIHNETYANIMAPLTRQDQMREVFGTLTTVKAKSYFYRILQDIQPGNIRAEDVQEVIKRHKKYLRDKFKEELEGTETDHSKAKSLDQIYTELHIIQGESEYVNNEHEIWEIEDKTKDKEREGVKIDCNDIFKSRSQVSSGQDRKEVRPMRTVMTKGIAGIGKTVSVKKFILDWADGRANEDLDFIFVLPFRELNLVIKHQFSLETLVRKFHPELKKISVATVFDQKRVLFIFDGLDESNLKLDFKDTEMLTEATEESSVDTLVTNLIREHLLPSAFVWITSRPGAVQRIPRKYVYQWTEVRGFNDPQKEQYFRKVVEEKAVAERIIDNIKMSRSLYIMCHIPIFCWIAAKVLAYLLQKMDKTHDENIKIPTTLTEMYTHFLYIQMQVAAEKYNRQDESEVEEIFKLNKEFILKLGRMAFEHLKESKIIFTANDLINYGIDVDKARVQCGLCTEVFKEEDVFYKRKFYCFVHLTVQEYFAALFVYHSFTSKKIDSSSLKEFLLTGSEKELESILEKDPVDLPVDELIEISIANSTLRKSGELDMFLRFLIGMSLQSTQKLLQGLIQQTDEHSKVVENIRESLTEMDLVDCSPERCLNLVHCLIELKDSSLHDTVQQYLKPNNGPETQLSAVQCSALADSILMSNTPLDEFDLKKYRPSPKGVFRLVPAVRNSRIVRISGVDLNAWLLETISSALQMPNSVLTELHLINSNFYREATTNFSKVLNSQCKLEVLSLSGRGLTPNRRENLAFAVKSYISNLKELELSGNLLHHDSLCSVFSNGLGRLEKLRLNRNSRIEEICKVLVTAVTSGLCHLRELELNHTEFKDSDMEFLITELMNTKCNLEVLRLSHNSLTETGCRTMASALCSKNSHLTELDLSYNDLCDSGVMALCHALKNPHCALKTLRLSFCKVTAEGCAALASALTFDHCNLRELDLSFNHLANQGVKLLTEIQRDPRCSLEKLNVDQNKDYWYDFKLLKKYACDLTLDPNTAAQDIVITEENKKAESVEEKQPYPEHPDRFHSHHVLCNESLTGRHYWEVECCLANVGVAYKSMNRVAEWFTDHELGENEKSWCWSCQGSFDHDYSFVELLKYTPNSTIGVYLDWPAGILSFFEVFPDSMTHLYTACTTFTEPLHPCFKLDNGSVFLCKLK